MVMVWRHARHALAQQPVPRLSAVRTAARVRGGAVRRLSGGRVTHLLREMHVLRMRRRCAPLLTRLVDVGRVSGPKPVGRFYKAVSVESTLGAVAMGEEDPGDPEADGFTVRRRQRQRQALRHFGR